MHHTAICMHTIRFQNRVIFRIKDTVLKKDIRDVNNLYLTYPREKNIHFACDIYVKTLKRKHQFLYPEKCKRFLLVFN